jgi:hypothetical protein
MRGPRGIVTIMLDGPMLIVLPRLRQASTPPREVERRRQHAFLQVVVEADHLPVARTQLPRLRGALPLTSTREPPRWHTLWNHRVAQQPAARVAGLASAVVGTTTGAALDVWRRRPGELPS